MDKLELNVEWTVDNQALKADMDRSKQSIEGVGQSIETVEKKVNQGITKNVATVGLLEKSYDGLSIQAQSYERIVRTSMDPKIITEYNQKLKGVLSEMAKIKSIGLDSTLSPGVRSIRQWNGLQNSINQISRELPAFTYSAQTGFMAISNNIPILVDEISRLKVENDALVASGKKGIPVWRQIISSMLSWQTLLSVGVTLLTVYGKEIGQWVSALFKGGQAAQDAALKIEIMNKALSGTEYGTAIKEVTELRSAIDGANSGLVSKSDALKLYNSTIGKTTGKIEDWNSLEKWQIDNEKNYLKFMYRKAEAQAMLQVAIDKTVEAQKRSVEGPSFADYARGIAMNGFSNIDASANIQNILGQANLQSQAAKSMNMFVEVNKELQRFAQEHGFDLYQFDDGKSKNTQARILAAHKNLIEELREIDKEYSEQFFTDDQKEQSAFDEKFRDIRRKIDQFNQDPDNAIKIDLDIVDDLETRLGSQLQYKQETTSITSVYESEFEEWKKFEELKNKTSEEYAKERYGALADYYRNMEERLWQSIEELREQEELDPAELDRLSEYYRILDDVKAYTTETEDNRYSELLSKMISYDQKRRTIAEKYEKDRADAEKWASQEQLTELDKRYLEEINQLDDANIKKLSAHRELFAGIERLSDASARKVIENAKKMLASDLSISDEERAKIEAAIRNAEQSLSDRLPDRLFRVSDEFATIADSVYLVNEELGNMIGLLSNVLRAAANVKVGFDDLKTGLEDYKNNKQDENSGLLGSISSVLGVAGPVAKIVGAVTSVVSGVINIFKASKESARQAALEMSQYKFSVLQGELEHNRLLRERARTQENINSLTNEEIELQKKLLEQQTAAAGSDYDSLLARIYGEGQQITGRETEKYGGFLGIGRKTRVVDITAGVSGYSYDRLEELYNTNQLTESTRKLFEQLKASKEEMDALGDSAAALELEVLDRMSGGMSADSISRTIIQGLQDGKRAVSDFSGDLEDMVSNALLSAMAYTTFDAPLKELVEKFRQEAKDGLTTQEIENFKEGYEEIVRSGIEAVEEIEKITGKSLAGNSTRTMSDSIRNISAEQADVLAGQVGGIHLSVVRSEQLYLRCLSILESDHGNVRDILIHIISIAQSTEQTARHSSRLEQIEKYLERISNGNRNLMRSGGN